MPKDKKKSKDEEDAEKKEKLKGESENVVESTPTQGEDPYGGIAKLKDRISALEVTSKANEAALKQMSDMSIEILEKVKNQPQAQAQDDGRIKTLEETVKEQGVLSNVLKEMVMRMDKSLRGIA